MIKYHKKAEKFILSQGKVMASRIYNAIEQDIINILIVDNRGDIYNKV